MLDAILREVGDYQRLGGEIWFGTDVGYIDDYDPALEFALLRRAGLSFDQILAALTTAPASRLPGGDARGRVESGMIADLVVLGGDPARDPEAWTRSEEHTSELQSLMRISSAVFCLKTKTKQN